MDEVFLQAETRWKDSTPPPGHPIPEARYLQSQEPISMAMPKLPQLEMANIEIAALADLYQQQLAEICAEHSLLLEDQAKLAKLIAPFVDEHGYVTGEFSETVLLLKQGLDLRLLEYEEDCRRIQQTERRLQRKIDDILLNYELLALEAQGVAESRLQEQVKNMRRIIRVLQSELDETRFQRDIYADETRRLRGICRFGHWTEDGYGISEGADEESGARLEAPSHRICSPSQLSATAVRQPRRPPHILTCLKASQRALGSQDSMARQRVETPRDTKNTGETRGGPRKSRPLESDMSEEAGDEGKQNRVVTRNGKSTEPSLFQEVLAKLLAGPEDSKRPPAGKQDMTDTTSVMKPRQSAASLPRRRLDAKRFEGGRTEEEPPAVVRRHRVASMGERRPGDGIPEEIEMQRRRAYEEAQRGYSVAQEDSKATAETGQPVQRSRTVSEEQALMDSYGQNSRETEKLTVGRTRSAGALEEELTDKGYVAERKQDASTRRKSSTTKAVPLPSRQADEGDRKRTTLTDKDRGKAGAATHPGPTPEAPLRESASFTGRLNGRRLATQTTESKGYSPPHTRSEALRRSPSPEKEELPSFACSSRASAASDHGKTNGEFAEPAGGHELATYPHVEVPLRVRRKSVGQRPPSVKQPEAVDDALPRRFQSRTLASPRLSRDAGARISEGYPGEREPVGEASAASGDLLLPAWRRARTLRSPTSRGSVESALQSPRWSNVQAGRPSASAVDRYTEENASTTWQGRDGLVGAQAKRSEMYRHDNEGHMPRLDRSRRSDSRPRTLSVASRSSSTFTSHRRLASPRSFVERWPSESAALSFEFPSREQSGDVAENISLRRATSRTIS